MSLSLAADNSLSDLVADLLGSSAADDLRNRPGYSHTNDTELLRLLLMAHLGVQPQRVAWALVQR